MEYIKGKPYFCQTNSRLHQFPYLEKDIKCEILIIGGGIDGAIANFYLSQNHNVVLVDKAKIGFGLTSCATALLEYQLDDFAEDLKKYLNENEILTAYNMAINSITKIENFIKSSFQSKI